MAAHDTLDIATFRLMYPQFADDTKYPDALLNAYYGAAGDFININDNWRGLNGATLDLALMLMTAHLLALYALRLRGQTGKFVTQATIDKVSTSVLAPPVRSQFDWWLNQTPYGQELAALLSVQSTGGWSIGGGLEKLPFRRAGGRFRL